MSRLSIAVGTRRMWMSFARGSFLYLGVSWLYYMDCTSSNSILQTPHTWTMQVLLCMPTR